MSRPKKQQPELPATAEQPVPVNGNGSISNITHVSGMYKSWFLDYASYVILDRAVPALEDGLKPVQRRLLHAMWEMEDGRYHKVANIIGQTMKYHPHGDASIGDALVQLGQKELLIDTQGNWGNIHTGDSAAAPRYIEARLSKFALEVAFYPKTTQWQASYDGRGKEPVFLPMKFPLLLAQGIEGIAVGLSCKILPHNFNELIDGAIKVLRGRKPEIFPDFPTGGLADFSQYNDGERGGRVRVRAKIAEQDKKTLIITEIPFGTTTVSLIASILKANDKGKIKIKSVEDNTAEKVEILVHLPAGVSPDKTIDALYAFTDCEVSISPNACVIENDKPRFLTVSEILKISTGKTLDLLKLELEIKRDELLTDWKYYSLERIFIEKRVYRQIEECKTWEDVIDTIRKGMKPYMKKLVAPDNKPVPELADEDIVKLTEIKIKRISRFDLDKAEENIKSIEEELKKVKHNLANIVDYTVEYFKELKRKYGDGRERKTEIKPFETIVAAKVATANEKLYVNREEGFAGFGMKKDDFVCDCSDIDDLIVIRKDGIMVVKKIAEKDFFGKEIMHVGVWKRGDERTVYNLIYVDGQKGVARAKRFAVTGVTRDKEYPLTKGKEGSKVIYLTANPNGEAEVVRIYLRQKQGLRKTEFDFDFSALEVKGRGAGGNIITRQTVNRVAHREKGVSTLGARTIWFDDTVMRLNVDEHGTFLGEFNPEDKVLTVMQSGHYQLHSFDLSEHFDDDMILIEKYFPEKPLSAVYYDGETKQYMVKRFIVEKTDRKVPFITENPDSHIEIASTDTNPVVEISFGKEGGGQKRNKKVNLAEFIEVKGLKAKGNQLSAGKVKEVNQLQSETPPSGTTAVTSEENEKGGDVKTKELPKESSGTAPTVGKESSGKKKKVDKNEVKGRQAKLF
ncbi:MAG: DNA gyrase/topoisomerase IV subunit A [Bacteroidetes bacterium]|nr:DNA gyrase/topoisomerase IV subunit A [Bacteroidota bacterium]